MRECAINRPLWYSTIRNFLDRHRVILAGAVAKRTLVDARRSGLGVEELISTLKEVAAEEEGRARDRRVHAHRGAEE
jgi:hypothetical protein